MEDCSPCSLGCCEAEEGKDGWVAVYEEDGEEWEQDVRRQVNGGEAGSEDGAGNMLLAEPKQPYGAADNGWEAEVHSRWQKGAVDTGIRPIVGDAPSADGRLALAHEPAAHALQRSRVAIVSETWTIY